MAPIIRLSDLVYKRLENLAIGFDTPSMVIERLLDSTTVPSKEASKNVFVDRLIQRNRKSQKKARNLKKERELKLAVGKMLKWGDFNLISNSILDFQNSQKKVLCNYSSYSIEYDRWFWGVSRKYWSEWDDNFYLALLMENKDKESYSFLFLQPEDALHLFPMCSESGSDKKINLRFYKSDGMLHLQEWKEYDVKKNTRKINKKLASD